MYLNEGSQLWVVTNPELGWDCVCAVIAADNEHEAKRVYLIENCDVPPEEVEDEIVKMRQDKSSHIEIFHQTRLTVQKKFDDGVRVGRWVDWRGTPAKIVRVTNDTIKLALAYYTDYGTVNVKLNGGEAEVHRSQVKVVCKKREV